MAAQVLTPGEALEQMQTGEPDGRAVGFEPLWVMDEAYDNRVQVEADRERAAGDPVYQKYGVFFEDLDQYQQLDHWLETDPEAAIAAEEAEIDARGRRRTTTTR